MIAELPIPAEAPPRIAEMLQEAAKMRIEPQRYVAALRDWVEQGLREQVRARARRGGRALHSATGRRLARRGVLRARGSTCTARATPTRRFAGSARRIALQPDNWTYKRQAWEFVDPILQGPSDEYEGDWLSDVREAGPENYYPPVDL